MNPYLHSLERQGFAVLGESWSATLLTRVVRTFEALPWLLQVAGNPDVQTSPGDAENVLRDDLSTLDLD